jgi:hypothetical protein
MVINIATYISEEENEGSCRVRFMCLTPHSTIFRYIVAVRGNRRAIPPLSRKDVNNPLLSRKLNLLSLLSQVIENKEKITTNSAN